MTTTICRIGYCPECAKNGKPKTGQKFITFGGRSKQYEGHIAKRNMTRGYTPHLYQFVKVMGNMVYYQKLCCMNECGTYLCEEDGALLVCTDDEKWSGVISMTILNWNALIMYRDESMKI